MILEKAIILKKISKTYSGKKTVLALNSLSLDVAKGEIFGLLGPNGAGKTTLVKILLGLTFKSDGEAYILGEEIKNHNIREKIGYLPENHQYPKFLTGEGVLRYFGRLTGYDKQRLEQNLQELIKLVDMEEWRDVKMKKYSKGMLQRIGLAHALLNDPEIVFLDEPTDGVDPIGRKEIRDILIRLKNEGKTVFLNSHLLSEIEMVCDRVAILNKGELVNIGGVEELTHSDTEYEIEILENWENLDILSEVKKTTKNECKISQKKLIIKEENIDIINSIIDLIRSKDIKIKSIKPNKISLEDYFIDVIKKTGKSDIL